MATEAAPKIPPPPPEQPPGQGGGQPTEIVIWQTVKDYLRLLDDTEKDKIMDMVPRARLWVEEHTGIAIIQRQFGEQRTPRSGVIRLSRGPLISVDSCGYADADGAPQTFPDFVAVPPSTKLTGAWPTTNGTPFEIIYTAGEAVDNISQINPRLVGAILALVEGEYTAGFAYPDDAITAATNCLFYLKFVAP